VNAAILLVATAWAGGADPAPAAHPTPAPAHAPVYATAPVYGACNGCGHGHYGYFDGGCCEDECDRPSFFERLCARFRHRDDDCCETTCDTCNTCDTCDTCDDHHGHGGLFSRFRHRGNDCCEDTCGHGGWDCGCDTGCDGPSFLDRLRACFHRDRDCCEDTCECAPTPCCDHGFHGHDMIPAPKKPAEKIPAPKGVGGDKDKDKGGDKGKAGEKPVGKLPIGIPGANIPEVVPSPTTIREPF
jgi:hypothetical protein